MATFILRCKEEKGTANVYVRVHSNKPKINLCVSTCLSVDIETWNKSQKDVKQMLKFRKEEPQLWNKLDSISAMLESFVKQEIAITSEIAKERIHSIVYAEQIAAEKERAEAEAKALEEGQATNFNDFISQFIRECETGKRKKKGGTTNVAPGTIKSYKGFQSQLKEYQETRLRVIDFTDLTLDFYNDFRLFLTDKEYSPNTIARMVKICKTICYAAEQLKLMDAKNVRSGFDVIYKDVDNVYLTEERIQELYEYDLSNRPAWEKVKDVFVVGCLTGQRVSDYSRICEDMITEIGGTEFILITQQKTEKKVYIPVDRRVRAILAKYDGKLPPVHPNEMNKLVKTIGLLLGWTHDCGFDEKRLNPKRGRRFCDMLLSHTARRSFATNAYKAGVPLPSIQAITGHSSEAQLHRYLKLDAEEKAVIALKDFKGIIKI